MEQNLWRKHKNIWESVWAFESLENLLDKKYDTKTIGDKNDLFNFHLYGTKTDDLCSSSYVLIRKHEKLLSDLRFKEEFAEKIRKLVEDRKFLPLPNRKKVPPNGWKINELRNQRHRSFFKIIERLILS